QDADGSRGALRPWRRRQGQPRHQHRAAGPERCRETSARRVPADARWRADAGHRDGTTALITRIPIMMFRSVSAVVALAALAVAFAMPAHAGDHAVAQVNKTFSMPVLKAKVGDTVTFKNDDTFAHNVFSLSETQNFDLGSYKKG